MDENAYKALFDNYYEPLVRFARSYLPTGDDAEEAVCEVFAQLWEKRAELVIQTTMSAYLYGAVRHRALDTLRSTRRRTAWQEKLLSDDDLPAHAPPFPNPEESMAAAELGQLVKVALQMLSERNRVVLHMRWGLDMSFNEIATVLGVSAAAAQMQYTRAIKTLRERLNPSL